MATEVKLPELGEGVTEGELVKWLVKPGDVVKIDQTIVELMTDKATVEVPTPIAGKIVELKFKPGNVVAVGSVLVTLEAGASTAVAAAPAKAAETAKPAATSAIPAAAKPTAQVSEAIQKSAAAMNAVDSNVLATPYSRRLAREMNVDINNVPGTGLAGRVTREDILGAANGGGSPTAAAGAPSSVPAFSFKSNNAGVEERVQLLGIRKKIAENLQRAKAIIPHFTLMDDVDVTELVQIRESLKVDMEKTGVKITYLPFVMKALIATIREFPQMNASIDDAASEIVYKKYFNIGFAADTPQGLVVPVIKDADHKSIIQIAQEITMLSQKARDNKLTAAEMKGATITVTNIGSVGGAYATPVINHPEVAILGMYKIQERPVLKNGELKNKSFMNYTITCDHRLIDGAVAARFLKSFLARIEKPGRLMVELV